MAPKKKIASKTTSRNKRRSVGLLGQRTYESEEDDDWTPGTEPSEAAKTSNKTDSVEKSGAKPDGSDDQGAKLDGSDDQELDVPLLRRRKAQHRHNGGGAADEAEQADAKRPRRSARSQPGPPNPQPQPTQQAQRGGRGRGAPAAHRSRGTSRSAGRTAASPTHSVAEAAGRRGGSTAGCTAGAAAATGPAAAAAARDWSGLTEALLAEVVRRACAASALPTAGAAACVCRHWRNVCRDLESEAKAAAAAAARMATARAAAEATAAAGRAFRAPSDGAAVAGPLAADVVGRGRGVDAAAVSGGAQGGADGGGLWGCLDVRGRPAVRFNDLVIQAGLACHRWSQVHTLRLRNCAGLTPSGLVAFCGGCPGLTSLELSQCESLVKLEPLRAVLASLPRLRLLDLSHCDCGMLDGVIKLALAPRPVPQAPPQPPNQAASPQQQQQAGDAASGGGSGGGAGASSGGAPGGSGGSWALPCPLRVLRARGCPRLGPGTFKALAPDVPYVTLPPQLQQPNGAAASAAVPVFVYLTELDLTGSSSVSKGGVLAVEKLQVAAPNLRMLRCDAAGSALYGIGGVSLTVEPPVPGPGFPQLRLCELGLSRSIMASSGSTNQRKGCTIDFLRRVVGRSPLLHTLDVSGALSRDDYDFLVYNMVSATRGAPPGGGVEHGDEEEDGNDDDAEDAAAAATAEAVAVAALSNTAAAADLFPDGSKAVELRQLLRRSLGRQLRTALTGPLRVLRASRSLLASDAGLHALAARFGGTLKEVDVSESPYVTDAGLLHVAWRCTALTSLDVSSTAITDYGVRVLLALRCGGLVEAAGDVTASAAGPVIATTAASCRGRAPGRPAAPNVVDLTSESDDDDDAEGADEGGGRAGGLRQLDISSCRGMSRATRHAAAEGLEALRRALGGGAGGLLSGEKGAGRGGREGAESGPLS